MEQTFACKTFKSIQSTWHQNRKIYKSARVGMNRPFQVTQVIFSFASLANGHYKYHKEEFMV